MSKFKVGQKVIKTCEWSCSNSVWKGKPIHKDEVHVIRKISQSNVPGIEALLFEGIYNPIDASGNEFAYSENEFAPIVESHTEFVEVSYEKIKQSNPKVSAS